MLPLLYLLVVSATLSCSPGTPFYPKQWEKWIEFGEVSTEPPALPTPAPLVESPLQPLPLTWRQISGQKQNSYRPPGAESFSEIYRRLQQKNMQHLMAVEPEGQRPGIF